MSNNEIQSRLDFAKKLVEEAGKKALSFFHCINELEIQQKSIQDYVSNVILKLKSLLENTFQIDIQTTVLLEKNMKILKVFQAIHGLLIQSMVQQIF